MDVNYDEILFLVRPENRKILNYISNMYSENMFKNILIPVGCITDYKDKQVTSNV